jgi:hypothetical protein
MKKGFLFYLIFFLFLFFIILYYIATNKTVEAHEGGSGAGVSHSGGGGGHGGVQHGGGHSHGGRGAYSGGVGGNSGSSVSYIPFYYAYYPDYFLDDGYFIDYIDFYDEQDYNNMGFFQRWFYRPIYRTY